MSIETEITRISTNVSDTLSAVSEMGGEVPEGATSNDMAAGVRSIPVGAKIDDTTPSSTTVYSSQKIESVVSALNEANAAQNTEIAKKANDSDLAKVAKSGSYTDLTNKPTIPTVPSALPNPNALTFTGAVNETYDGSAAKSVSIPTVPTTLPNPSRLILSGAVTAEYDGSAEVSVEIPAGGGYTLPIASATQLGGVMPAAKTGEMTQAVGVDAEGRLFTAAGSGGGGGANSSAQETVLASGTVPSGTAKWHNTATGLTIDNLREWSVWGFRGTSSVSTEFGPKVGHVEMRCSCTKYQAVFGWLDGEKSVIHIIDGITDDVYTDITKNFFRLGFQPSVRNSIRPKAAHLFPAVGSGDVTINTQNELTADLNWQIVGLIK